MQYIRIILGGSCQFWSGAQTVKNKMDLERAQQMSLEIFLPSMSLSHLILEPLDFSTLRRNALTVRFAKKMGQESTQIKQIVTLNPRKHTMQLRKHST